MLPRSHSSATVEDQVNEMQALGGVAGEPSTSGELPHKPSLSLFAELTWHSATVDDTKRDSNGEAINADTAVSRPTKHSEFNN